MKTPEEKETAAALGEKPENEKHDSVRAWREESCENLLLISVYV